jgi:Protein of unknown function (DUF2630)
MRERRRAAGSRPRVASQGVPDPTCYGSRMDDTPLLGRINELYEEEERLYSAASVGGGLTAADQERLAEIKVALDQCYDLLHQRQAKRDAGQNPDEAQVRPPEIVEHYQQ